MGEILGDGWEYRDNNGKKHWIDNDALFCQIVTELGWPECSSLVTAAGYENLTQLKKEAYEKYPESISHMERSAYMASKLIKVMRRGKI